ncbi:SPIN90/Ldb17 leucine-rich domain-containing protein [Entamoeba marina]
MFSEEQHESEFESLITKLEDAIEIIEAHEKLSFDLPKEYYNMYLNTSLSEEERMLALKGLSLYTSYNKNFYSTYIKSHLPDLYETFPENFSRPYTDWALLLLKSGIKDLKCTDEMLYGLCETIMMVLDEDSHPTRGLLDSLFLLHQSFFRYPESVKIVLQSEAFLNGRLMQGLILLLNYTDYKEMMYSIALDIIYTLFGQEGVENSLYINDFNVLISDVFPLLCRNNNNSYDLVMEKMCKALLVVTKIAVNNSLYEPSSAFTDSLEMVIEANENKDLSLIKSLLELSADANN